MEEYICASPIGSLRLEMADDRLAALHFCEDRPAGSGQELSGPASEVASWLAAYFAGKRPDPSGLQLFLRGTPFQQRVWERLLAIPYGQTTTYGAIASEIGSGPRAVGGAVGANPICIITPCHRVIAASGKLGGYAEGLERKIWLLRHEGCAGFQGTVMPH